MDQELVREYVHALQLREDALVGDDPHDDEAGKESERPDTGDDIQKQQDVRCHYPKDKRNGEVTQRAHVPVTPLARRGCHVLEVRTGAERHERQPPQRRVQLPRRDHDADDGCHVYGGQNDEVGREDRSRPSEHSIVQIIIHE